jgi:hypothetical protein
MELLLIFLTGFFLWLWLYDGSRRAFARSRAEGGKLLLAFPTAYKNRRFFTAVLLLLVFVAQFSPLSKTYDTTYSFDFLGAINIALILFNVLPPPWYTIAFEIHEKGVVAGGLFAPWSEILYFRVLPARHKFEIQFRQFWKEFRVAEDHKVAAATAMRAYVEERSESGKVLSSPLRSKPLTETAAGMINLRRKRFQFDLRSLLLFFIFASTVSSWIGIQYRRWDLQEKALAKWESFSPKVERSYLDVEALDFSHSPQKPTDDDLPKLANFPRLLRLDLAGAPVTDMGLIRLHALANLQFLNLWNTQVTFQGCRKLKKAMPKLKVLWIPPPSPPPLSP